MSNNVFRYNGHIRHSLHDMEELAQKLKNASKVIQTRANSFNMHTIGADNLIKEVRTNLDYIRRILDEFNPVLQLFTEGVNKQQNDQKYKSRY